MRYTEYHDSVVVIKDKTFLNEAMAKMAKYEDAEDKNRMRKETLLQKIITWVLKKIGLLETRKVSKEEMCKSAVESGVCQRECDICIWNRRVEE